MAMRTGHVGLNVTNLERSRTFYQEVFGFEVVSQKVDGERHFAFLGDGQQLVLTLWEQSSGRFSPAQPGLHHLSFEVPSVEAVQAYEQRLGRLGVPLLYDGVVPHREGADSGGIFFEDPDGVRLEIFTPHGLAGRRAPNPDAPTCGFF